MPVSTYTKSGSKATTAAKLDKVVFEVKTDNHELLKQAYVAYMANGRDNLAITKKRGEVSGGGRKPWRQKGTGRARVGSSRTPLWRGGGIIFGPTGLENYTKTLNLNAKRLAIRQALSMAAKAGVISVIETLEVKDAKTSTASKLLTKINAKGRVLIAVDNKDANLVRAFKNLTDVKLVQAKYLNAFDILNADTIVITVKGLEMVHDWLGEKK